MSFTLVDKTLQRDGPYQESAAVTKQSKGRVKKGKAMTTTQVGDPKENLKRVFAQRLTAARMRRGWNQSELARQAAVHTEDRNFGRALVSMYERARMFPNPFHLSALSKALGVQPDDLAPSAMPKLEDAAPQLETRDLGGGKVLLRINQPTEWRKAMKILEILRGEENGNAA